MNRVTRSLLNKVGRISSTAARNHCSISSACTSAVRFNVVAAQRQRQPVPRLSAMQTRSVSFLPEAFTSISIWGGSGWLLKTLHGTTTGAPILLPYWACFAAISVGVRTILLPVVVYGAHTASRFAKVVPEVQFLLSLFANDMKQLRQRQARLAERVLLMRTNLQTLSGIYKLHNIHPFAVFLSPLLQLPIFWYISIDLRKIVNGLDPALAQQLVDASVLWIPDLTEPDPWYGLPVLAGLALYANVEVAVGRRSLSGPNMAQANTGVLLKDLFQSFAVFMPCFTSQMPAGVQIYIVTSFCFTALQSAALRTEAVRNMVGLPSLALPPPAAKYAQEFVQLKQLEQKARQARGPDGPVLGQHGVLARDFTASFVGRRIPSSIVGSTATSAETDPVEIPLIQMPENVTHRVHHASMMTANFVPGISALPTSSPAPLSPPANAVEQQPRAWHNDGEHLPHCDDSVMDRANRGEIPTHLLMRPPKGAAVPLATARDKPLRTKRFRKSGSRRKK